MAKKCFYVFGYCGLEVIIDRQSPMMTMGQVLIWFNLNAVLGIVHQSVHNKNKLGLNNIEKKLEGM